MTLTPSKRFVNTTACSFTPTSGSAVTITGITSVSLKPNTEEVRASGDGDFVDTFAAVVSQNPVVSIASNEIGLLNAVNNGTVGTLVWTQNDGRNGAAAGGGAIIFTVSNSYLMAQGTEAPHRQVATGTYDFHTFSTDGSTSPVAFAAA